MSYSDPIDPRKRKSVRQSMKQEMRSSLLLPTALGLAILLAGAIVVLFAPWPFWITMTIIIGVMLFAYLLWSTRGASWGLRLLALAVAIPAVAGMMGMKTTSFLVVDIIACVLWAPALLLPGMLFGASLEVASEYTGRLTVILVILVGVLWLTWWLIRSIYEPLASRSARWVRHLIRWSRKHPVLGRVTGSIIDPSRPEVISVTMMGILLVVFFWGLVMLLFLSPFSSQPQALDQAVRDLALSLRNHLADPVAVGFSQLSRWPVSVFSALALLLWLLGAGRSKAADRLRKLRER